MGTQLDRQFEFEYIVVGSGAGGGTLASRLAQAGRRVLLLEAGGDPLRASGDRLPEDYQVPAFHAFASENEALKWDFFVRHYADLARQRRDEKFCANRDGVLYPRSGSLGGCTAINAMILVYPHNADWQNIADLTGDRSWAPENMRGYFERLEDCRHRLPYRLLSMLGINPSRHGWEGWLTSEKAIPLSALCDGKLVKVVLDSLYAAFAEVEHPIKQLRWLFESQADPNDWRLVRDNAYGIRYTPLTTRDHQRIGARERVVETAQKYPDFLRIELDALATEVIFDNDNRAVGVRYLKGERLYRAHAAASGSNGEAREVRASKEVILAGGAFNTPQLLMLSGIGARKDLERRGVKVRVDLPGVGKNLQDRYEVGVVNRMNFKHWGVLEGARFAKGDPQYRQWESERKGVYTTNGAVLAAIKRSSTQRVIPDLFCFALLGKFKGYFPGYAKLLPQHLNYLTWAILKAHTINRAGEVSLRSADPRDVPQINFRYFDEGSDACGEDLASVVDGIKFVRKLTAKLKRDKLIAEEELPGEHFKTDDQLRDFVRDNAWGHHASCTCPIGPRDKGGVLQSDFRVHGTRGLRVVDASVFPQIPGFFIVSAVYMIGEKAADVILQHAAGESR